MKKLFVLAGFGFLTFTSCTNSKEKQKAMLGDILKSHEQVMADDEKAQMNKMKLDTLIKQKPALKDQGTGITNEITVADSSMEEWMHNFQPEYTGKSTDEVVKYLTDQKKSLSKVDSQLQAVNSKAEKFISQNK